MTARTRPSRPLRRLPGLRRCDSGVALIEFTMSLPVLLTIGLVGLEVANYALAHLRVSNIAVLTADNAARVRDEIHEGDIQELFTGAMQAGQAIGFEKNGRIILSALEESTVDDDYQWIRWQRCDGDKNVKSSYGKPLAADGNAIVDGTEAFKADGTVTSKPSSPAKSKMTAMGPPANQIRAQSGTSVMVAEVVYDYQPIVSSALLGPLQITYVSAFNVRQRADPVLYNRSKLAPAACG
jgi:hypothetical protein